MSSLSNGPISTPVGSAQLIGKRTASRMEQRNARSRHGIGSFPAALHPRRTPCVLRPRRRRSGEHRGQTRKGWLAAYRDATVYKTAYAWGLRRNEVRHLQTVDFSRNPHAPEFTRYGVLQVRFGKASRGSAPKRRSVLTVFDWAPDVVDDWGAQRETSLV